LTRKANAMPAGGGGGGWAKMNDVMAANRAKRQAQTFGTGSVKGDGHGGTTGDRVLAERKARTSIPAGVLMGEIENFDGADRAA
jgi:hypothetical protein